ncbi:fungal-specific transcription factor domain-containing protein [Lipomyces kononenkoae]|uniref:Fungal-specific transcription factor domain-containing protein n=1 Tax=Lipomyces kononenkoae TaxID=34357 RepID=A0ACC3T0S8_LIPKO
MTQRSVPGSLMVVLFLFLRALAHPSWSASTVTVPVHSQLLNAKTQDGSSYNECHPLRSTSASPIQILNLISIYASHRPSDNKQWHIGGIAIRLAIELGLHRHSDNWKLSADESDLRRRVFRTTYAIEITLAFNLGRPASIYFEDADAPFPNAIEDMIMPIHHFRHRQIQEQMLSQVYRGRKSNMSTSAEENQFILDKLQDQPEAMLKLGL